MVFPKPLPKTHRPGTRGVDVGVAVGEAVGVGRMGLAWRVHRGAPEQIIQDRILVLAAAVHAGVILVFHDDDVLRRLAAPHPRLDLRKLPVIGLGTPCTIGLDGSTMGSLELRSKFDCPPKGKG